MRGKTPSHLAARTRSRRGTFSGETLLRMPVDAGVRRLLARLNNEAMSAYRRVASAGDPEALHDFRVAVRRMRSVIRAFRPQLKASIPKPLSRSLRAVARGSNASRDLEVQMQWLASQKRMGPRQKVAAQWLAHTLEERQATLRSGKRANPIGIFPPLHGQIKRGLVSKRRSNDGRIEARGSIVPFAAPLGKRLMQQIRELEKRLRGVRSINDQYEAHMARIAGKRLRYLLEPLADSEPNVKWLVGRLKELQDVIGGMRDANLLRSELRRIVGARSPDDPLDSELPVPPGELRPGLIGIIERLHRDEASAYHKLRSRWLGGASREFFRRVKHFATSLGAFASLARDGVEVERKYLLSALPPRALRVRPVEIEQGWIPGEKLAERLRRAISGGRSRYYRTVKIGAGVRRMELEERTTKNIFDRLWPTTEGNRVRKRRYPIRDGRLTWEIDQFSNRKLVLAEVELRDESENPPIPAWLKPYVVREVTDEARYLNRNLAR